MRDHWEERWRDWGAPALIAATGIFLLVRTRRTWGDPIVDFGREIYLA